MKAFCQRFRNFYFKVKNDLQDFMKEVFKIYNTGRSVKFLLFNNQLLCSVAYTEFSKGGARKFRKFEINEDQNENLCSPIPSPLFCPKLGEAPPKKRKKSLHSNLVRFLAKKRSLFTVSALTPSAQVTKGGPCHNFAYFSMLIIMSWRPKEGGHGPMAPPTYAPDCVN